MNQKKRPELTSSIAPINFAVTDARKEVIFQFRASFLIPRFKILYSVAPSTFISAQSPISRLRNRGSIPPNMAAAAFTKPMTADPSQHRQELIERLDVLRRNESFCDVTVAVKGKEFKAHKPVLAAASPFFLSLLESDMRESNEQLIRIELEEATAAVMEEVLKYIYTGNVSVTEESCHNFIVTADYLLLPGLKTAACDFLKKNVTPENCIFSYYFADKYQCQELKEKSHETINSHFCVVMETDDFVNLDVKQVMEWVSSDDVIV